MGTRHNLKHYVLNILRHNRDGSFSTQSVRRERLMLMIDQLVDGGYKLPHIHSLKPKHIQHLTNRWLQEGLSAGTIKNRLTGLRWVAQKHQKPEFIPP